MSGIAARGRSAARGLALAALAAAGGCSDQRPSLPPMEARAFAPAPARKSDVKLAYSHSLTLGLPPERVAAHFAAARDRCLGEAALRCVLLQSSISEGAQPTGRPAASLQVRLPHESVAPYVAFVTAPLPGEAAADVVLRDQSTRAEELTQAIRDGGRRIAQLTDYRTRLTALAERPDTPVDSLVKVAGELSEVQSQIEEAEGRRRGLEERVDTEAVSLSLRSDQARAGAFAPVEEAWAQGGRILGESAASALRFAISSLPWLPVVFLGILILRGLWRLRRKRRTPPGRLRMEDRS